MKKSDLFTSPAWDLYGGGQPRPRGNSSNMREGNGGTRYHFKEGLSYLSKLSDDGSVLACWLDEQRGKFPLQELNDLCRSFIYEIVGEEGFKKFEKTVQDNRIRDPSSYFEECGIRSYEDIGKDVPIIRSSKGAPVRVV